MTESSRSTVIAPPERRWRRVGLKTLLVRVTAALVLFTFLTMLLHGNWSLALLLICGGVGLWLLREEWRERRERAELLKDVDAMSAEELCLYATELFRAQGYAVLKQGRAGSPPADLLLSRGKENFACWLQHNDRPLGAATVARAAAAVRMHRGWRIMVLSSRRFTLSVRYRARREGCVLIDRDSLANMVAQYRRGHRVIAFPYEEAAELRGRKWGNDGDS